MNSGELHVVVPYGRQAGSSRVRVYEWLERTGVAASVSNFIGQANARPAVLVRHSFAVAEAELRLRRLAKSQPQRLLIHREASPLSVGRLEKQLLRSAGVAIYDFDDALPWDGGWDLWDRIRAKASKAVAACAMSDRVIAGNETLAEIAALVARDVTIIPSCVDTRSYQAKTEYRVSDPPLLGWIGSASGERYLTMIEAALLEVQGRTGARLQLVGAASGDLGPLEGMTDRIPWSETAAGLRIGQWDVGLMPVSDGLYERGKCGYKLLQYAAAGLPSVTSPVGVNRRMATELGFVSATGTEEWVEAIMASLQNSTEERSRIGQEARIQVQRRYSYDTWKAEWLIAIGESSGMHLPADPQ
jgi:glycosyltransferase involved in cell wall biosynthesis